MFPDKVPTTDEWETARIKSYGTGTFIKGEEYDIELLAGIQVSRLFSLKIEARLTGGCRSGTIIRVMRNIECCITTVKCISVYVQL